MHAAMPLSCRLARLRTLEIEQALSIWPEPTPDERAYIKDVQEVVQQSLSLVPLVKRGWEELLALMIQGKSDPLALHQSFLSLLGDCSRVMQSVLNLASEVANRFGEEVLGAGELSQAISRVSEHLKRARISWAGFDEETARRRAEEVQRDGGLTIDEAFQRAATAGGGNG